MGASVPSVKQTNSVCECINQHKTAVTAATAGFPTNGVKHAITAHEDSYKAMNKVLEKLEHAQTSGVNEGKANQASLDAMIDESNALCDLLSSRPNSQTEALAKVEYIKSTWWYEESIAGTLEIEPHHLEALLSGITGASL